MKVKKENIKKKFLIKVLIKLIRKFGYEIIDQNNLQIPLKSTYANQNLSEGGKKSVTVPFGETKITRKVKSLTIIIRSYTFGNTDGTNVMLDQSKKRIFNEPKIEYTLRTIKSVIKSCELAQSSFKNLKIKILITDDSSSEQNLLKITNLFKDTNIENKIISIEENEFNNEIDKVDTEGDEISKNMISNMRNYLKSLEISKNEDTDLFYFLEDDYIHTSEAITEMLFAYEKFSSQLNDELFLCPADYPYLYSNTDDTKLFFGNMRHWRSVKETLITFLTSKKMINRHFDNLKLMGTKRHHPMELKLHQIYEKEYCLSPIPSLAMHATNINTIYGVPPNFDWKKVWDENN